MVFGKYFCHTKIFLFFQLCKYAVKFLLAMAFTLFAMRIVCVALSSSTTQTYRHNPGRLHFFAPSFLSFISNSCLFITLSVFFTSKKYVSPYYFIKFAPVNTIIIKIHRCLNFFSYLCRNPLISIQGIDANTKTVRRVNSLVWGFTPQHNNS